MFNSKLMKHLINISIFIILVGVSMSSCVREKNFPPQPVIEFEKFITYGHDSADCFIKFRDGDGDIGYHDADKISEDDLKMKYLYKGPGGVFIPVDSSIGTSHFDTLYYSYRVPYLTPDGQYKALDGEIKIKLRTQPLFAVGSVVKFEITLRDRAGNKSNMVTTNEINVVP
jgi:hypothetical protein